MKQTIKSTKSPYNVYIESDYYVLEVFRGSNKLFYIIDEEGDVDYNLLNKVYFPDKEPEIYYLDYVSGKGLNTIHTLTENYDYNKIVDYLTLFLNNIDNYSYLDFSMEDAYIFSDAKDSILQAYYFSGEKSYKETSGELESFFNTMFYDKKVEHSLEDKKNIVLKFNNIISILNTLKNH